MRRFLGSRLHGCAGARMAGVQGFVGHEDFRPVFGIECHAGLQQLRSSLGVESKPLQKSQFEDLSRNSRSDCSPSTMHELYGLLLGSEKVPNHLISSAKTIRQ